MSSRQRHPQSESKSNFNSWAQTSRDRPQSGRHSEQKPMKKRRGFHRSNQVPLDDCEDVNFKVVVRVRPPLPRELNNDKPFQNVIGVDDSEKRMTISENLDAPDSGLYSTHTFTFDYVYDQNASQEKVYDTTAKAVVESSLKGYNATIFAYGQTGTGKTYTMEGFNSAEERGIIPRAIEQIFKHITSSVSPRTRFLVRASYLQIYNEQISDLLKPERTSLLIREDKKKGVFVEGLSEWVVRSPEEIYGLMERGGAMRATGAHKMNELSSRSHAVFIIICEQSTTTYVDETGRELSPEELHHLMKTRGAQRGNSAVAELNEHNVRQSFKVGKLNLVDLAGSERVRLTGATGQRLEESKKINQSLSALGNVIAALTDPRGRQHIPYRDSKLTRILEDSLGGNCKTTMMAMTSPALEAFTESLSTLKFANRAKNIKNQPRINEDLDQRSLLRKYERELKRLRQELQTRSQSVVDKRRLLEMDEQRRQAEQDKMAAIRALEARSVEMMREKAEKRKLERRISMLTSQMLVGGVAGVTMKDVQNTPVFRSALKEHQIKIRQQYEAKLAELEKERESIEEEKAQVDRYKQLLLKQRDIMIALTQRLNERDEQIMALQDELDAYDRHQKALEEKLDEKTAALIHLQRVTMEHQARSPIKNNEVVKALGSWAHGQEGTTGNNAVAKVERMSTAASGGSGQAKTPHKTPHVSMGPSSESQHQNLITHKQFRPHHHLGSKTAVMTCGGGDDTSSVSSGESPSQLLSAEEKIVELNRVVTRQESEIAQAQKELEEVQAEKVSMEYLLRERLEKLVQSEIEARLASYKREDKEHMLGASAVAPEMVSQLRVALDHKSQELLRLKRDNHAQADEVRKMRRKMKLVVAESSRNGSGSGNAQQLSTSKGNGGGGSDNEAVLQLESRVQALTRQHSQFRGEMAKRLEEKTVSLQLAEQDTKRISSEANEEVALLRHRVTELDQKLKSLKTKSGSEEQARELTLVKERCSTHEKERRAILTIMEQKIKTLVENATFAAQSIRLPMGTDKTVQVGVLNTPHGQRLAHELQALQRLVNASVAALKNSSSKGERTTSNGRGKASHSSTKMAPHSTGRQSSNKRAQHDSIGRPSIHGRNGKPRRPQPSTSDTAPLSQRTSQQMQKHYSRSLTKSNGMRSSNGIRSVNGMSRSTPAYSNLKPSTSNGVLHTHQKENLH